MKHAISLLKKELEKTRHFDVCELRGPVYQRVAERSKAWVCSRSPAWDCELESRRGHGCLSVVSVVCLSGRGLCDGLITRPEESYRLCCVIVCDLETSKHEEAKTSKWVVKDSRRRCEI
jgi:hypothetical protein